MVGKIEKRRRMELRKDIGNRVIEKPYQRPKGELKGPDRTNYFACLICCKSYKRANLEYGEYLYHLPCPECARPALNFGRNFKPPKTGDLKQWQKIRFLAKHGFWFQKVGTPYPRTLAEAKKFVVDFADRGMSVNPEFWNEIEKDFK